MEKTFHYYRGKVYDQDGIIHALYGFDYDVLIKQIGFSMIISPQTVYGYIDRLHKVDRVVCVNMYGQLKTGGNAHELLQPFFLDPRFNKKDREIEGYQLCSKPGVPFPWALPQEGASILADSFWLYAEVLDTLDTYEGHLYKRIQIKDGSYLYVGEPGDEFVFFKQKRRSCWANGKEVIAGAPGAGNPA
ncbi:hypothetical protein FACS189473_5440 [Spirochaetia bacterium]|nr:hypothetical protein FACS189473_5440 [Spirochaetia bacterium]